MAEWLRNFWRSLTYSEPIQRLECPSCGKPEVYEHPSYSHWSGFDHPEYDECRACGWRSDTSILFDF